MSDTTMPAKIDAENYVLELESFRDPPWMQPFRFYILQFKNVEGALKTLDRAGKSGEDTVKALINSVLAARMRTKAKMRVADEIEAKKRVEKNELLLIDEKEAAEFIPGEREPDSESGLHKQYQLNLKKAKEAKAAGDNESAQKFLEIAKGHWTELQERALKAFSLD